MKRSSLTARTPKNALARTHQPQIRLATLAARASATLVRDAETPTGHKPRATDLLAGVHPSIKHTTSACLPSGGSAIRAASEDLELFNGRAGNCQGQKTPFHQLLEKKGRRKRQLDNNKLNFLTIFQSQLVDFFVPCPRIRSNEFPDVEISRPRGVRGDPEVNLAGIQQQVRRSRRPGRDGYDAHFRGNIHSRLLVAYRLVLFSFPDRRKTLKRPTASYETTTFVGAFKANRRPGPS